MFTSVVTLSSLYYYNKLHNQINELSICDYDENSKQIGKSLTIITSFKQMVDTIKSNNLELDNCTIVQCCVKTQDKEEDETSFS